MLSLRTEEVKLSYDELIELMSKEDRVVGVM